jgi:hypothetical protein
MLPDLSSAVNIHRRIPPRTKKTNKFVDYVSNLLQDGFALNGGRMEKQLEGMTEWQIEKQQDDVTAWHLLFFLALAAMFFIW